MPSATQVLYSQIDRERIKRLIDNAPAYSVVTVKDAKRTIPQNDIIHAMCTDIARQLTWHGQKWPMEDWKYNLLGCFKSDLRIMPRADGFGIIPVGGTRDLAMSEASDFIEFIRAFAAQHSVQFSERTAA